MSPIDNSPAFLGPTKREQVMTNKKAEARAKEVRENKAQSEFDAVLHKYMDKANERHSGVEKEFTGLVYVRHDFNDRNMPIHPHVRLWQITFDGQQYLCPSTNGGSKKDVTETEYVILPDGTVYAVHCNYLSEKADFSTISEIDKQHERFPLFEGAQKKRRGN